MLEIKAHMHGESLPMAKVPDEVFADDVLGRGLAIVPSDGLVVAPCSGTITNIAGTMHAVCLTADDGTELLIHIGINTVAMGGKGFTCYVKTGQHVQCGDKLLRLNLKKCQKAGCNPVSPLVVIDPDKYQMNISYGPCTAGKTTLITL